MINEDSKIVRFLKSIKIENFEDFDMDFTSISKSKVDKNSFIYNIKKETPWKYDLLEEFFPMYFILIILLNLQVMMLLI